MFTVVNNKKVSKSIFSMAEAAPGNYRDQVDDGHRDEEHGISDQVIDPWCEPCLEETKVKVDAFVYCPECNNHLCSPCQESHRKWHQNHRLVRGSKMPRLHGDKPIKYSSCVLHVGNISDHYCLKHSVMVCNDCKKKDHNDCRVLPIPDVCKDITSKDIKEFKSIVNDIQQNVDATQATLRNNINAIESQKKDMIQSAALERDKLIAKANGMFNEMVSKIIETCSKATSGISDHIETLSDEKQQLDQIIDTFDKKTVPDMDANIFIQVQNIVTSTKECKQEIEDTINQLKVNELTFDLNEEIGRFLDETKLGEIREIIKPMNTMKEVNDVAFPQPKDERSRTAVDISKIYAMKTGCFNVKTSEDKKTCDINGMALTSRGTLLIADFANKKVKFFYKDSTLLTTFDMTDWIYGVAVTDDSEAVVSTIDRLHFLDISALPSVKIIKSISVVLRARLASCDGYIVIASQFTNPACLKMIDRNGKEIWSLTTGLDNQQIFEMPYGVQITTFNGTNAVMVTDWGKETLTVVDASNGTVMKIVDLKDKAPYGLTVDDDGNVFICSPLTREILVLPNDLSQTQILLKGQDIQEYPVNIVYRKSTNELYVANGKFDETDRFKLSLTNQ